MYRPDSNMRQVGTARRVGYSALEVQKASQSLCKDVNIGSLSWLKAKFEHYPLEAVPNVWEGDEGMMKHVHKFPVPPCITLPGAEVAADDRPDSEPEDEELFQKEDLETAKASVETNTEARLELKRRGMERAFWIKMARTTGELEYMHKNIMLLRHKFSHLTVKIKQEECQQLVNMYTQMQKIKYKLDKADKDYTKNKFTDEFQTMSAKKKIWFQQKHKIQGQLPDNLEYIVNKFNFLRTKLREIIHSNFVRLQEFKDITSLCIIMKDALIKSNKDSLALKVITETEDSEKEKASCLDKESPNEILDNESANEVIDDGGKAKKAKSEQFVGSEESDAIMSKEDIFWESLVCTKKMLRQAATNLVRVDKEALPDICDVFKKKGSVICKQMLNIRRSIIACNDTLAKLKEEMQTENYEDKKLFTAEMLASEGIEGLTTDNSLLVVEALFTKLKNDYLRVQDDKYFVLEKFGYTKDLNLARSPKDDNVLLFRICAHSRTEIDLKVIARLAQGNSGQDWKKNQRKSTGAADQKTNKAASLDAGDQNTIVGETTDFNTDVATSEQIADGKSAGGGDSVPMEEDAEDEDESSPEDSSNFSKNVNSLSFFMNTLGPDALTIGGQRSVSATEDFIVKERQYWDRLQKLSRLIDKVTKQVRKRATNTFMRKRQIKDAMQALQHRIKKLSENYELEKVEAHKAGYCTNVVYENLEYHLESNTVILLKSLDQIQQKVNTMYRCFKETTERLGVPWMFKI